MRGGRWRWWRDQGSRRERSTRAWMGWDKHSDTLSRAMCAREWETEQGLRRLTTTRTFTCYPSVSRHCGVSCASCWCFSGSWFSRCQLVSGRFYTSTAFLHAYATPSTKFFSSGCCSPTLSCHRQLNLYPKFLHISHRENGSFEVLSLQFEHLTRRCIKTVCQNIAHGLHFHRVPSTFHHHRPSNQTRVRF